MQLKIIQRRMNIPRRAVNDRPETARCQRDAGAFVVPQALRVQQIDAEEERDEQRDQEPKAVFVLEKELNQVKLSNVKRVLQRTTTKESDRPLVSV